jgi:hypothetical protein
MRSHRRPPLDEVGPFHTPISTNHLLLKVAGFERDPSGWVSQFLLDACAEKQYNVGLIYVPVLDPTEGFPPRLKARRNGRSYAMLPMYSVATVVYIVAARLATCTPRYWESVAQDVRESDNPRMVGCSWFASGMGIWK